VDAIRARLDAGIPSFFLLWSPHAFNIRYGLSRIQLPAYTPRRFEQGRSDFPTDVLEKVGSMTLSEHTPLVAELYSLFEIDNSAQESMLGAIDSGLSTMQAVCSWMREEENTAVWEAWVPVEKVACDAGHYAVDETSCAPCPAGSASVGGTATSCMQCSAGAKPRFFCS
jgi:ABC-type proline/glycine betaine transport system substrate-binding protein